MNTSTPDLLLESPLLQLPNELLKAGIKAQQRVVEKDLSQSIGTAHEFSELMTDACYKRQLDDLTERLRSLRRKLQPLIKDEAKYIKQSRQRIAHMSSMLEAPYGAVSHAAEPRLLRLLAEYMLRNNLTESASCIAAKYNIHNLLDLDIYAQSKRIREALLAGDTTECLSWCSDHKSALKRNKNQLEFELRQQEFIELVRARKIEQAITYSKRALAPYRSTHPKVLNRVCSLICHDRQTRLTPYRDLYSPARWLYLADLFTRTHQELFSIPTMAPFEVGLAAGLSALKTAQCGMISSTSGSQRCSGCPVCSEALHDVVTNIPMAHAARSHLIDPMTRIPIDHDNEPMVFPDGRVVGSRTLHIQGEQDKRDAHVNTSADLDKLSVMRRAFFL